MLWGIPDMGYDLGRQSIAPAAEFGHVESGWRRRTGDPEFNSALPCAVHWHQARILKPQLGAQGCNTYYDEAGHVQQAVPTAFAGRLVPKGCDECLYIRGVSDVRAVAHAMTSLTGDVIENAFEVRPCKGAP